MGLKDHLEDGTGHILCQGLDLDYLHVDGAERQAGPSAAGNRGVLQVRAGPASGCSSGSGTNSSANSSYSSSSSSSNFSEESIISDSEDERLQNQIQDQLHRTAFQAAGLDPDRSPRDPAPTPDPVTDCRSKLEFALKLGYSEDLVLLVLRKLGPEALINDMLGELVKLGTKIETEQQGGPTVPQDPSSLACPSSSSSSLNSCRLMCSSKLEDKENLRPVVVDGSNVAMSHGNKEVFSCQGIQLAVDWFLERGHRDVTVFVPAWRKEQSRPDALITDQEILRRLEKEKILVFTPSRRVQGRRVVCYDDRFIVKLAYESDGIIVSNDNYRDLANEKPEWKKFIDERLLMYSFVNDKFMPPDDPLGRHGPSLENFLRKRPVILEPRKQPCPYGKKCTYGHKCKFYHPERGSQPQRAVADELRASARISSVTSRDLVEQALMAKSQSPTDVETSCGSKQQSPSPLSSLVDLTEIGFLMPSQAGERRGISSIMMGSPAPGGHRDPGSSSRVAGASGLNLAESLLRCESPEDSFGSLVKNYSNLSLLVPQTPERFLPADLRALSFPSDCSSEGSASSDSFSPDPLVEDSPKCHHHHIHHQHHHPAQHAHHLSCGSLGLGRPHPSRYSVPPGLRRQQAFSVDDSPSSLISQASPRSFKMPTAFNSPQHQHSMVTSYPNSPHHSQASSGHPQSQTSPIARNLMGPLWQEGSLPDSRVYEGSTLYSRSSYSALTQQVNWEADYQSGVKPSYDPFSYRSLPQLHGKAWHAPWSQQVHSAPHVVATSTRSQQSLPCIKAHKSHQASATLHQEPPVFTRYQNLREKLFSNLCGIFPPDLVRVVMSRNPLMMDAQELAAAILLEKSQHGS